MDKDRIAGSAKELKGAVKEIAGKAVGDAKLEADGKTKKPRARFRTRLVVSRTRSKAKGAGQEDRSCRWAHSHHHPGHLLARRLQWPLWRLWLRLRSRRRRRHRHCRHHPCRAASDGPDLNPRPTSAPAIGGVRLGSARRSSNRDRRLAIRSISIQGEKLWRRLFLRLQGEAQSRDWR